MRYLAVIFICLLSIPPVAADVAEQPETRAWASAYFNIYNDRRDFPGLMDFYAPDVKFRDMIYDVTLSGKEEVREFLDWNRGNFAVLEGDKIFVLDQIIIDGKMAVASGVFKKFRYEGRTYGPWGFLMSLEFNDNGKIIKHTDWINYTPRSMLPEPNKAKSE